MGDVGCGKTTLAEEELAYRAWQQWGILIDFFKVLDLYATIEAIKKSTTPVHFVIIDDFVSRLDARDSMKKENKDMTVLYYEIRHQLEEESVASGGSFGGLVILLILIQCYTAIDKRLRKGAMFKVFKTYDAEASKILEFDPEVDEFLQDLSDRSNRLSEYKARELAIGFDTKRYYTAFKADKSNIPEKMPFTIETVQGESFYKKQRDQLVYYLIDNFDYLEYEPRDKLKAELLFQLDELKESTKRCRIAKSDFTEIILRATRLQQKQENQPAQNAFPLDPNAKMTYKDKIACALCLEKVATLERLEELTRLSRKTINDTLYKYSTCFKNIVKNKGVWSLKGYKPSQDELVPFEKIPVKSLVF